MSYDILPDEELDAEYKAIIDEAEHDLVVKNLGQDASKSDVVYAEDFLFALRQENFRYVYYLYFHPSDNGNRHALLKVVNANNELWITSGAAKTARGILNRKFYERVLREIEAWDYK